MQKFKSMSPADRLKQGHNTTVMGIQYMLYLVAYTVLTVVTGFYLWHIENDPDKVVCTSVNSGRGVPTL